MGCFPTGDDDISIKYIQSILHSRHSKHINNSKFRNFAACQLNNHD